jgi:hypothetical protein
MEKMQRVQKAVLIGVCVVMALCTLFTVNSAANSATRDENVKKIERFLSNDAGKTGLTEKGETYERVMLNIGMMSDTQVESLAEHATAQIQVGGELRDSGDDFWTFYKWYLIASLGFLLLLIIL